MSPRAEHPVQRLPSRQVGLAARRRGTVVRWAARALVALVAASASYGSSWLAPVGSVGLGGTRTAYAGTTVTDPSGNLGTFDVSSWSALESNAYSGCIGSYAVAHGATFTTQQSMLNFFATVIPDLTTIPASVRSGCKSAKSAGTEIDTSSIPSVDEQQYQAWVGTYANWDVFQDSSQNPFGAYSKCSWSYDASGNLSRGCGITMNVAWASSSMFAPGTSFTYGCCGGSNGEIDVYPLWRIDSSSGGSVTLDRLMPAPGVYGWDQALYTCVEPEASCANPNTDTLASNLVGIIDTNGWSLQPGSPSSCQPGGYNSAMQAGCVVQNAYINPWAINFDPVVNSAHAPQGTELATAPHGTANSSGVIEFVGWRCVDKGNNNQWCGNTGAPGAGPIVGGGQVVTPGMLWSPLPDIVNMDNGKVSPTSEAVCDSSSLASLINVAGASIDTVTCTEGGVQVKVRNPGAVSPFPQPSPGTQATDKGLWDIWSTLQTLVQGVIALPGQIATQIETKVQEALSGCFLQVDGQAVDCQTLRLSALYAPLKAEIDSGQHFPFSVPKAVDSTLQPLVAPSDPTPIGWHIVAFCGSSGIGGGGPGAVIGSGSMTDSGGGGGSSSCLWDEPVTLSPERACFGAGQTTCIDIFGANIGGVPLIVILRFGEMCFIVFAVWKWAKPQPVVRVD